MVRRVISKVVNTSDDLDIVLGVGKIEVHREPIERDAQGFVTKWRIYYLQ